MTEFIPCEKTKEKIIEYLNEDYWTSGRDDDLIRDFIKAFFDEYQTCRFCQTTDSILTKETCCTG